MKQVSSLAIRIAAVLAACAVFVTLAGISGLAQQAPAPGAAPGQAPAGGAPGRGARGGGAGGGRGVVTLGDGPWEYGNGPNRFRVTVVTKNVVTTLGYRVPSEW